VHSGLPVEDMAGFIAYAKANPGKLNYSSSGVGGGGHLLPAFIAHSLGLEMVHISFNSAAPAVTAVAGRHAQVSFIAPSTAAPHVAAGAVRVLATSGRNRTGQFPELKTFAELGYPEFTRDFHYGVYAPAGTPPAVLARLRQEVASLLQMPETQARLTSVGLEPLDLDGPAFRDFVINDLNRWREIARAIDFRIED
jgi:tripartite-type tricarboxylate transporter receptor subunit TctC